MKLRRATIRRMHDRHAPILLDFCRGRLIFSPFTRVLSSVSRLAWT